MIGEFESASILLQSALDRYIQACSTLKSPSIPRIFLDRINSELQQVDSYQAKIAQAKTILSQTKNYSLERNTFNSLPAEIMLQISLLVASNHKCCINEISRTDNNIFPSQIEPLLQVCSRWRHTLINTHSLWTHLDVLSQDYKFGRRLLARAEAFATRASNSLLSLHIADIDYHETTSILDHLASFVALISPRLSVVHSQAMHVFKEHVLLLSRSLIHTVPGVLTQLILSNPELEDSIYHLEENNDGWPLTGTHVPLADPGTLRLLTALRLHDVHYDWNSLAYHGLVELSLTFWESHPAITEPELCEVVRSSPQLRKLWLRIRIVEPTPNSLTPKPATLEHLQVLKLYLEYGDVARILRCIEPGPQLLKMSLDVVKLKERWKVEFWTSLEQFFAGANVTKLRVRCTDPDSSDFWVPKLLARIPNLEHLELADFIWLVRLPPTYLSSDWAFRRSIGTLSASSLDRGTTSEICKLIQALRAQPVTIGCFDIRMSEGDLLECELDVEELTELCSAAGWKFSVSHLDSTDPWY